MYVVTYLYFIINRKQINSTEETNKRQSKNGGMKTSAEEDDGKWNNFVFSEKWTTKTNHWVAQEDKQGYCESHQDLSSVDYEGQCEKVFSGLTF